MNSERLYRSSGTKESHCFELTSSTKHEIRDFDTVVEQWLQRNVQKNRDARAKLLFCPSKPIAIDVLVEVAVVFA